MTTPAAPFKFYFSPVEDRTTTGPTFHPGEPSLLKKAPIKKKGKYPFDHVRVQKRKRPLTVPELESKTNFEVENPHILYTANKNLPNFLPYKTALQFLGRSITERYIYFENYRLAKTDPHTKSFLKSPSLAFYNRFLLFWAKKEQHTRTMLRRLVALWKAKKYSSRLLNTEDPATMAEPEKPVLVFDSTARGSYAFEASTIKRQLEENLGYCKWLVSEPQTPKNPMTNLPFHVGQITAILKQLELYGMSSWLLEGYKEHHYDLLEFLDTFRQPLRLRTIEHCRKNPMCEDTQEFVEEFMEDEFEFHDIPYNSTLTILKWALKHKTELKYVRTWIDVWAEYYKVVIRHGESSLQNSPRLLDDIHDMSGDLFRNRTMIQKLGRMRLEALAAEEPPEPVQPPIQQQVPAPVQSPHVFDASRFEWSQQGETPTGLTITHTMSDVNILISADAISDALLEALLRHAPPSD